MAPIWSRQSEKTGVGTARLLVSAHAGFVAAVELVDTWLTRWMPRRHPGPAFGENLNK